MSFGWSVGDILAGLQLIWTVYEAFSDGPKSAKKEYREFTDSFNLIKYNVESLQNKLNGLSQERRDAMSQSFQETERQCQEFVKKHEILARSALESSHSHDTSVMGLRLTERYRKVFSTVRWPTERDEARRLKRKLDEYVNAAILETTTTLNVKHDDLVKAVKRIEDNMGRFLALLSAGTSANTITINEAFLRQFSHYVFTQDLNANRRHLNGHGQTFPERAGVSLPNLLASAEQFADKMEFLTVRRCDPYTLLPRKHETSLEQSRSEETQAVVSVSQWAANLMDAVLEQIQPELKASPAIDHSSSSRTQKRLSFGRPEPPEQIISRLRKEWEQRKERTRFHFLHLNPDPLRSKPITTDSAHQVEMAGVTGAVTIAFYNPNPSSRTTLHDSITGHLGVSVGKDDDVEYIKIVDEHTGYEVLHEIRSVSAGPVRTTFIPWIGNRHVEGDRCANRMDFRGAHQVTIGKEEHFEEYHINPTYTFSDSQDFKAIHNLLLSKTLGRTLVVEVDIMKVMISPANVEDCSFGHLRVLGDEVTGQRSLLYFSNERGFQEWELDDFEPAKSKDGSDGPRIILTRKLTSSNASGASMMKRQNSSSSSVLSSKSFMPYSPKKLNALTIYFEKAHKKERDTCMKCLEQRTIHTWAKAQSGDVVQQQKAIHTWAKTPSWDALHATRYRASPREQTLVPATQVPAEDQHENVEDVDMATIKEVEVTTEQTPVLGAAQTRSKENFDDVDMTTREEFIAVMEQTPVPATQAESKENVENADITTREEVQAIMEQTLVPATQLPTDDQHNKIVEDIPQETQDSLNKLSLVQDSNSPPDPWTLAWRDFLSKWTAEVGYAPQFELASLVKIDTVYRRSTIACIQSFCESFSGEEWIWSPLSPPQPSLSRGKRRIWWQCRSGSQHWHDVTDRLAETLIKLKATQPNRTNEPDSSPSTSTMSNLPSFSTPIIMSARSGTGASQHNPLPNSADPTLAVIASNIVAQVPGSLWILVCVPRQRLNSTVIGVHQSTLDDNFFAAFKEAYRRLRGWRYWFAPKQFAFCHVSRFERYWVDHVGWIVNEMPESKDYEYAPRGSHPYRPPLCKCEWQQRFYHKFKTPGSLDALQRLPKRKQRFQMSTHMWREDVWGLDAQVRPHLKMILMWFVAILLGSLCFALWWLKKRPTDLQNAVVPFSVASGALTVLFLPLNRSFKND